MIGKVVRFEYFDGQEWAQLEGTVMDKYSKTDLRYMESKTVQHGTISVSSSVSEKIPIAETYDLYTIRLSSGKVLHIPCSSITEVR